MNEEMKHVFEISGLGKAPFKLSAPDQNNNAFFCEHCGTVLKNRFFIKSSDGKISVVGIDCLNKTGDVGLISSVKLEKKQKRILEKQVVSEKNAIIREEKERSIFGKTKEDKLQDIENEIIELKERFEDFFENNVVYLALSKSDFGLAMIREFKHLNKITDNMKNSIENVVVKQLSNGARKGSEKYKSFLVVAKKELSDLYVYFDEVVSKNEKLKEEKNRVIFLKV